MKFSFFSIFLLLTVFIQGQVSFEYNQTNSLNIPRADASSISLPNGKVLITGGSDEDLLNVKAYKSCELYDPINNTWEEVAPMARERRAHLTVISGSGKVYVIGGFNYDVNDNDYGSCEEYNYLSNEWKAGPDFPVNPTQSKSLTLNDGRVLIVGFNSFYLDEELEQWIALPEMPIKYLSNFSASLLNDGNIFVCGGSSTKRAAMIFDLAKNKWVILNELNFERDYHQTQILPSGNVLIVGGHDNQLTAEVYNVVDSTFKTTGALPFYSVNNKIGVLDNGKCFVFGTGDVFIGSDTKAFQEFDEITNCWKAATTNFNGITRYNLERLNDGSFLLFGGYEGSISATAQSWIINQKVSSNCRVLSPENITVNQQCFGTPINVNVNSAYSNNSYKIYQGNSLINSFSGSGTQSFQSPTNLNYESNYFKLVREESGCPSKVVSYDILNPDFFSDSVYITYPGDSFSCIGESVQLKANSSIFFTPLGITISVNPSELAKAYGPISMTGKFSMKFVEYNRFQ